MHSSSRKARALRSLAATTCTAPLWHRFRWPASSSVVMFCMLTPYLLKTRLRHVLPLWVSQTWATTRTSIRVGTISQVAAFAMIIVDGSAIVVLAEILLKALFMTVHGGLAPWQAPSAYNTALLVFLGPPFPIQSALIEDRPHRHPRDQGTNRRGGTRTVC